MSDTNIVFHCLICGWTNIRMDGEPLPQHKCEWDTKVSETADGILVEYNPRYPEDEMSNADRFPCGDEIEEPTFDRVFSAIVDDMRARERRIDDGVSEELARITSGEPSEYKGIFPKMSITNDEQAKYGTERAPMLSDEAMNKLAFIPNPPHDRYLTVGGVIRDYYESLITKGVLRVAKPSTMKSDGTLECEDPECLFTGQAYGFKYCPECAGRIVKP